MDASTLTDLLNALGLGQYALLVLALMGLASAITATFAQPKSPAGAALWVVLNLVAANVRHARNREGADKGALTDGKAPAAKPPD